MPYGVVAAAVPPGLDRHHLPSAAASPPEGNHAGAGNLDHALDVVSIFGLSCCWLPCSPCPCYFCCCLPVASTCCSCFLLWPFELFAMCLPGPYKLLSIMFFVDSVIL